MKTFVTFKKVTAVTAVSFLLAGYLIARGGTKNRSDVVQPDNIYAEGPFSFAVTGGRVEGEVIEVQTTDGVVVQRTKPDRHGRVFLAGGLPAGAYLIARSGKHSNPVGNLVVKQRPSDALVRPGDHRPDPLRIQDPPKVVNRAETLPLTGRGFSPDYAENVVRFGRGEAGQAVVLAAAEDQLKLAPLTQLQPGRADLTVMNMATGQRAEVQQVLICDLQGHIERSKLVSGVDQTRLVVNSKPEDAALNIRARVLYGPVDFGAGRKEIEAVTQNGVAVFPVHAERGAGPFELAYTLGAQSLALLEDDRSPQDWVKEKAKDCAAAAEETENSNNKKDLKKEAKDDQDYAEDKKNWDKDGQPTDKKKLTKFLNAEIARLRKILKKEGEGAARDTIKKAIKDAIEAGKAAGLKF